jgi:chemotaxis signal transduction protein
MSLSILPLQIHGLWLAVPALAVHEILGRRPWVAIAGAPAEMPGVIAWRGRAIAMLDVGRLLEGGRPGLGDDGRRRTVVMQHGEAIIALPVDELREVKEVAEVDLRPAQQTRQRFASRELELDGVPVPLLDLGSVLDAMAPATERA